MHDVHDAIKTFTALWYKPKPGKDLSKKYTIKDLYKDCLQKNREWVPNQEPLQEVEINAVIHC